jgi:hypothetical protein
MLQELKGRLFSFSEMLSATVNFYIANFVTMAGASVLVTLPFLAVQSVVGSNQLGSVVDAYNTGNYFAALDALQNLNGFNFLGLLLSLLTGFASVMLALGFAFYIMDKLEGKAFDLNSIINRSFTKLPAWVITAIVVFICMIPLFIALIVPAIYFGVCWMFITQEVAYNNKMALDAMSASREIVANRWLLAAGYTLGVAVIFGLIVAIPSSLIVSVFDLNGNGMAASIASSTIQFSRVGFIIGSILQGVLTAAVITPVTAIFTTLMYINWSHNRLAVVTQNVNTANPA